MRSFAGEHDRDFTLARLREVRRLLDAAEDLGDGATAHPITTQEVYAGWAGSYDEPGRNQLVDLEQAVVWEILDGLPVGVALDAACGTGRHSVRLAELGHRVIGVDSSPEMLARARAKLPGAELHEGDVHALPLPDDHVDLVVCGLALEHVPDLGPVLREFVRVLRPGGHLVLSDSKGFFGDLRPPVATVGEDGRAGYGPSWRRPTSAYLRAALPLGLELRRCEEPTRPDPLVDEHGTTLYDAEHGNDPALPEPGEPPDVWALHRFAPEAVNAAYRGTPAALVLHFQLALG